METKKGSIMGLLKASLPIIIGVAGGMWVYELSKKGVAKISGKA